MTQPEASPPVPEEEAPTPAPQDDASTMPPTTDVETRAEPATPWTPERVSEWNAYYDIYVMLAVLLLAFVVSAVRVDENNPVALDALETGQLIVQQGSPVVTDSFSYSETGQRWINIPWLFQLGHAAIFKLVRNLVPSDPTDLTANQAAGGTNCHRRADRHQCPGTADHGVDLLENPPARARAVVVGRLRDACPGSDRRAPFRILPGGIAGPGIVAPPTWGLLLLAIEMLILHRAYNEGRRGALYALVPLFLVWANLDESFFVGLLILAAALGRSAARRPVCRDPRCIPVRRRPSSRANRNLGESASQSGRRAFWCWVSVLRSPCSIRRPLGFSRPRWNPCCRILRAQDRVFPVR